MGASLPRNLLTPNRFHFASVAGIDRIQLPTRLGTNQFPYIKSTLPFGIVADEVLKVETGYKVMTFRDL
jgi:hypothetical protein